MLAAPQSLNRYAFEGYGLLPSSRQMAAADAGPLGPAPDHDRYDGDGLIGATGDSR